MSRYRGNVGLKTFVVVKVRKLSTFKRFMLHLLVKAGSVELRHLTSCFFRHELTRAKLRLQFSIPPSLM